MTTTTRSGDTERPSERPERPSRLRRLLGNPLVHLLAAFVLIALVQGFVVKLYQVPSASMETTMVTGDRILVNRLAYIGAASPQSGDVIVFEASESWGPAPAAPSNPLAYAARWLGGIVGIGPSLEHSLTKRIIAVGGQTVACCDSDGRMLVDGIALDEPYLTSNLAFPRSTDAESDGCADEIPAPRCVPEFVVPDGHYIALGDNRGNSADSLSACRGITDTPDLCLRTVAEADVVGRVVLVVWPLGRFGGL